MAMVKVKCPYCGSKEVLLYGKNSTGKQRYLCRNKSCAHKTFQMEYRNNACRPGVHEKIVKQVHEEYLKKIEGENPIDVLICKTISTEMDEMWSFYHDKSHQIWLWWAIDHATNTPLAFTFGTREHKILDDLLALLQPFPIRRVYTDNNFAYHKRIPAEQLTTGKRNTQKIERDYLTLRTRIKRLCRKTICFSKNEEIHKAVIGTFINVFFWGRDFDASTIP